MDIKMELTVHDTLQRILNKINDELDVIGNRNSDLDDDLVASRAIEELSRAYDLLTRSDKVDKPHE